ncbi:Hypothetical predicted protein [Cloeon dipterum]|uniref:SET domain-containing protein n=1 Tax=Cloeon dipterum TaxID=197152 RepID=A0A8S1DBJ1_9INSE|nr:Hypothetical predicted protein [Cloeon dipterum]
MKRSKLEEFSWSDFLWAWFAVNTRAVYVEPSQDKICKDKDNIALAPFLDLLNHSPHIEPNKVGWNGDFYQIKASKSFKKHDQVYISYGAHDNLTLCLEYGFIVAKNSHDRVIFSKEDILKVLQPDRKVDECDGIIWCTREGLNWTGKQRT